jgi:cytoskeletal protein CcmA (bactofilin family)
MWKKPEIEESQSQPQPKPVVPVHINSAPQPVVPVHTNPAPQPIKEQAMIGKTIHVKGDLMGEEDLLIEGYVDGKIQLRQHNVTIGKNGHVNADIYGNTISIEGDVKGNLFGEDQLILRKSSKVRGNITAPRVILEDGSNFKGSIDMNPKEVSEKPAGILNAVSGRQFDRAGDTGSTAPAMSIAEM